MEMALDQRALNELRALDPDGSSELMTQIIGSYLSDASVLVHYIGAAFRAKDIVALTRHAHSLKSTSLTVGAVRVAEIAKELEIAGKSGTLEVVPMFLTVLSAEYAAAAGLLKAEQSAVQSPRVAAPSSSASSERLVPARDPAVHGVSSLHA
jgi:HPt (histidine-containing phosphotransfer) domain-containing protein